MKPNHLLTLTMLVLFSLHTPTRAQPQCDVPDFLDFVHGSYGVTYMPVNKGNLLQSFSYERIHNRPKGPDTTQFMLQYDRKGRIVGKTVRRTNREKVFTSSFEAIYYPYSDFIWHDVADTHCNTPYCYNGHPYVFTSRFMIHYTLDDTVVTSIMYFDPADDDEKAMIWRYKDGEIHRTSEKPITYASDFNYLLFNYPIISLPVDYFLCLIQEDMLARGDSLQSLHFTEERLEDTTLTYITEIEWPGRHRQYDITFTPPYYTITETYITRRKLRPRPHPSFVAQIHYNGLPAKVTRYHVRTGKQESEKRFYYDRFGNPELMIRTWGDSTEEVVTFINTYREEAVQDDH